LLTRNPDALLLSAVNGKKKKDKRQKKMNPIIFPIDLPLTSTFDASAVAVSTTFDSWLLLKDVYEVVASAPSPCANRKPAKQSFVPLIYGEGDIHAHAHMQ